MIRKKGVERSERREKEKKQIKREKGQGQRETERKKERRTQSPKERITSKKRARLRWHRFWAWAPEKLFCGYIGLFCRYIGLFCGYIKRWTRHVTRLKLSHEWYWWFMCCISFCDKMHSSFDMAAKEPYGSINEPYGSTK